MKSEKGGVAVASGWKVINVDATNKKVILEDGYEIKYDKCLIATGKFHRMYETKVQCKFRIELFHVHDCICRFISETSPGV